MNWKKIMMVLIIISLFSMPFLLLLPNFSIADLKETNQNTNQMLSSSSEDLQTLTMTCGKNGVFSNYNSMEDFIVHSGGWNITNSYLKFTEINIPTFTKTIEDYSNNCVPLSCEYAGSFEINQDTTLTEISLFFSCSAVQPRFYYNIYNATWDGFKPKPDQVIYSSSGLSTQSTDASWKSYDTSVDLKIVETDNNTFFLSAYSAIIEICWYYERDLNDGSDDSYTYIHDFAPDWNMFQDPGPPLSLVDLNFKIELANYIVNPSEINMQVNGSTVSDIDFGSGDVTFTGDYMGDQINFDVSSDCELILYTVNYECNFQNQTMITASSEIEETQTVWTMQFEGNFIANTYEKQIKVTIGSDWSSVKIYLNDVEYSDTSIDYTNNEVLMENITINGSWVVKENQETQDPETRPDPPRHWWHRFIWWLSWKFFRWFR